MAAPELAGIRSYWSYFTPTVYERLVGYYASDSPYARLRDLERRYEEIVNAITVAAALPKIAQKASTVEALLGYYDVIKWYGDVSTYVSSLVNREPTLAKTADTLATIDPVTGLARIENLAKIVVGAFYTKMADLVGGHISLMWYADPDTVTAANTLFKKATDLSDIIGLVKGTTPGGLSQWDMLRTYLGDDWYKKISSLITTDGTLLDSLAKTKGYVDSLASTLTDDYTLTLDVFKSRLNTMKNVSLTLSGRLDPLTKFTDFLSAQATLEGVTWDVIMSRMRAYSSSSWSSILGSVKDGVLPTITASALFNKAVDIKGRLNQLASIGDDVKTWMDGISFTVGYNFTRYTPWDGLFRKTTFVFGPKTYTGIAGLRTWLTDVNNYATSAIKEGRFDSVIDTVLILGQGLQGFLGSLINLVEKMAKTVGEGGWR